MTLLRRSAVERHIKHLEAEVERLRYELDWTQANLKLMTEERDKAVAEVKRLRKERDHNELHGLEYKAEVERLREDRDKFAHEITRQDVEIARLHRIEEAARIHCMTDCKGAAWLRAALILPLDEGGTMAPWEEA